MLMNKPDSVEPMRDVRDFDLRMVTLSWSKRDFEDNSTLFQDELTDRSKRTNDPLTRTTIMNTNLKIHHTVSVHLAYGY